MPDVVYSRQARADMSNVWLWVAEASNVAMADRVIERIELRVSMLGDHPELGPARPQIAEGARALISERWLILYRVDDRFVRVVRVIDGARDLRHIDWNPTG